MKYYTITKERFERLCSLEREALATIADLKSKLAERDEILITLGRCVKCSCSPDSISMMCPIHGEELAKEEMEIHPHSTTT